MDILILDCLGCGDYITDYDDYETCEECGESFCDECQEKGISIFVWNGFKQCPGCTLINERRILNDDDLIEWFLRKNSLTRERAFKQLRQEMFRNEDLVSEHGVRCKGR